MVLRVYVDSLLAVHHTANWRWTTSCHLMAHTREELHEFATTLGIERRRFQNRLDFPHYDLWPELRARAVEAGALELGRREFVAKVRELRPLWAEEDL